MLPFATEFPSIFERAPLRRVSRIFIYFYNISIRSLITDPATRVLTFMQTVARGEVWKGNRKIGRAHV